MKLDNFKNDVEVISNNEEVNFDIDQKSLGILFKGFSDNLYSNKIGSVVREITSNCFDSHIEAGIDDPVEIIIKEEDIFCPGSYAEIIFKDVGVGLSPERIINIYSKYFASTKRNDNDQIGGFGIGCKSPLAYTEVFYVTTWYNNTRYEYVIHRGEQVPKLMLQHQEPETRRNGTNITIPIKNRWDLQRFREELTHQLRYFSNINYTNCHIDNDYQIIRGEHFILRVNNGQVVDKELSVCLGNVAYPLNYSYFENIANDTIKLEGRHEFALTFEVGDLPVTFNREALEYTDDAINVISNKLIAVHKEFANLCSNTDEIDFLTFLQSKKKETYIHLPDYKIQFNAGSLHPGVFVKVKGFPTELNLNKVSGIFSEYSIPNLLENGRVKKLYISVEAAIKRKYGIYRTNTQIYSKRKTLYLETINPAYNICSLIQEPLRDTSMYQILGIEEHPSKVTLLKDFRHALLKEIINLTESYDNTEIDPEWLKEYEAELKANRLNKNEEITLRRGSGDNFCYHSKANWRIHQLPSLVPNPGRCIYYTAEEESLKEKLKGLDKLINLKWYKVAKNNVKVLQQIPGFIHISDAVITFEKKLLFAGYSSYFRNIKYNTGSIFSKLNARNGQHYLEILTAFCKKYGGDIKGYSNFLAPCKKPEEPVYFTYKNVLYNLTEIAENLNKLSDSQAFRDADNISIPAFYEKEIIPIIRKKILKYSLTFLIY